MPSRRRFLAVVGGIATLAGCTAGGNRSTATTPNETADSSATSVEERIVDPKRGTTGTVRQFYRALLAENVDALNTKLVHPKSPTYPVQSDHLPPAAFQGFSDIQIAAVEEVSVQDRVVQRLFADVGRSSRMRKAMGADRLQYVHTKFYVETAETGDPYEADVVDYTVEADDRWYIRYNADRSIHGQGADDQTR